MATYTYETSADEELAIDYDQAVVNGQRFSQTPPLPPLDRQTLFSYAVSTKWLGPSTMQRIQAKADPILQAFYSTDQPTRDKITAAVAAIAPIAQTK